MSRSRICILHHPYLFITAGSVFIKVIFQKRLIALSDNLQVIFHDTIVHFKFPLTSNYLSLIHSNQCVSITTYYLSDHLRHTLNSLI